jgi:gliding motility-associated-like protein
MNVNPSVKNNKNQTNLKSGDYTITVKDKFGCQQSETVSITEPQQIKLTASVTHQPSCTKNNGEITAVTIQPLGNYQINLLGNHPNAVFTSNKITNLPADELYKVYVLNTDGCSSDTINLVVNPAKDIPGKWTIQKINPTCKVAKGSVIIKSPKGLDYTYYLNNNNVATTRDTVFSGLEGVNKITVLSKDNCQRDTTITIAAQPLITERINIGMKSEVCKNTPILELNNPLPLGYTIKWYDKDPSLNTTAKVLNTSLKLTQPTQTLYYSYTESGKCESVPMQLQVKTSALELVETKVENTKCGLTTGVVELFATNGIGKYMYQWSTSIQSNFSNDSVIKNLREGDYIIKVKDKTGCEVSKNYKIDCDISTIPQIITPKSGNKNQTWVINYYHKYPKVEVSIFNRWGSLVYKSGVPYEDNWDGKPNVENSTGEGSLPSGTYYYLIDKGTGEKPETGFIELVE